MILNNAIFGAGISGLYIWNELGKLEKSTQGHVTTVPYSIIRKLNVGGRTLVASLVTGTSIILETTKVYLQLGL